MAELKITHLGRQGDGVAAGPIYVPRALPGEIVSGEIDGDTLVAPKIITPSEHRVKPPCRHFKACGGCQMQHASDVLVAEWKTDIIRTALSHNQIDTEIRPILTSPTHSRRRAKYAARRTKSGSIAGFRAKSSHDIIDIQSCTVTHDALAVGPELTRALAILGASRKGELVAQVTVTQTGLDVSVTGGKPLDRELQQSLPGVMAQFGLARLVWDGDLVAQADPPRHKIGRAEVSLPPGAFLQATAHGEAALQACVMEALAGIGSVVDLFAGCGTFALHMADTRPVHAVEGDAAMTRALQDAANHAGLIYPVSTATRDLFGNPLLLDELAKFEGVVLDPPRAGAAAQIHQIAKAQPAVIAYVSCDPGSFARDVKVLCDAGYRLDWVQPVDQFRWSPHVELAARLSVPHITN